MRLNNSKIKNTSLFGSQKGLIAIDFLFGFILSFAFLVIFFAIAYSLSIVEVVQYVAFASSRTYMGADIDEKTQASNAQAKASGLVSNKFSAFFGKGWFNVGASKTSILRILSQDKSLDAKGEPEYFIGVEIPLTIHLLDLRIPFFGRTKTTDPGDGFQTVVSSYLIREPTQKECLDFNDKRPQYLLNSASAATYSAIPQFPTSYVRISDNGC